MVSLRNAEMSPEWVYAWTRGHLGLADALLAAALSVILLPMSVMMITVLSLVLLPASGFRPALGAGILALVAARRDDEPAALPTP